MVSGEECYRTMTELEQRRWMRNVVRHSPVPSSTLFAIKYFTFCDFIESSFNWAITKEGTQYWGTICEKYKLHDQLNPGQYFKTKPPDTF